MSKAIAAISSTAILPLAGIGRILSVFWAEATRDIAHHYRPELHYMRGPGPAWRAKHGLKP